MLHGLCSSCGEQCLLSSWGVQASQCGGFSCCGAQANECMGFSICSIWDLPRSGIKPVSPAWAGGFFPTESPGKPSTSFLNCQIG